jgi:putative membrane protein
MKRPLIVIGATMLLLGSVSAASAKSDIFLTDAIQINLAEISVGDLAQKNGDGDDVKSFGKMLVDDHTASNTKATSLAQANGVTPPTEPNAADKKKHDELEKLSGAEFDREFAKAMVKGHEEAIAKFEAAAPGLLGRFFCNSMHERTKDPPLSAALVHGADSRRLCRGIGPSLTGFFLATTPQLIEALEEQRGSSRRYAMRREAPL